MSNHSSRPIRFRDYLPEVLRGDERDAHSFQNRFLQAFEDLFEELQSVIEGVSHGDFRLVVDSVPPSETDSGKIEIKVKRSLEVPPTFPANTFVTFAGTNADSTTLAEDYPGRAGPTSLFVRDADFARFVNAGSEIVLHAGGLPDLFKYCQVRSTTFASRGTAPSSTNLVCPTPMRKS